MKKNGLLLLSFFLIEIAPSLIGLPMEDRDSSSKIPEETRSIILLRENILYRENRNAAPSIAEQENSIHSEDAFAAVQPAATFTSTSIRQQNDNEVSAITFMNIPFDNNNNRAHFLKEPLLAKTSSSLNSFKAAIEKNPQAERLLVQENREGLSVDAPISFYEQPLTFLFNSQTVKQDNQHTGEVLKKAIEEQYGTAIADLTCPQYLLETGSPWGADTIKHVISSSFYIHENHFMKAALAAQKETRQAINPIQIANAAAARSQILFEAAEKAQLALKYISDTGLAVASLSHAVRYALATREEENFIISTLSQPIEKAFNASDDLGAVIKESLERSTAEKEMFQKSTPNTISIVNLMAKLIHTTAAAVHAAEAAQEAAEITRPLPSLIRSGKPAEYLDQINKIRMTYLEKQMPSPTSLDLLTH